MAFPTKIMISGSIYTVTYEDEIIDEDGEVLEGDSDFDDKTIRIKKSNPKAMRSTIMHEVIHMAIAHAGLQELLAGISDYTEETLVCALENSLFPIYSLRGETSRKKKVK